MSIESELSALRVASIGLSLDQKKSIFEICEQRNVSVLKAFLDELVTPDSSETFEEKSAIFSDLIKYIAENNWGEGMKELGNYKFNLALTDM